MQRGYMGIFHHFTAKHLHRYLAEFEIRWSMIGQSGAQRLDAVLESASSCRLIHKELFS